MHVINTYNPSDILLSINDFQITGFANDQFIELNQNSRYYRLVRGIRGKSTRIHSRDRSGYLTFSVMQTHPDNEILSKISALDDLNFTGRLNITINDLGGQTGIQLGDAFIEGQPDIGFSSKNTTARSWKINYQYLTRYHVGGNTTSLIDILSF